MSRRKFPVAVAAVAAVLFASGTSARDDVVRFPVGEAITAPAATEKLNRNVTFFFGDTPHPEVERSFGVYTSNKKTNGFNKSAKVACDWAFLSALLSFQDRAMREGGDAVINIASFYKSNEVRSTTEYECGTGDLMVGVAFRGEVVKLKK
ncbi:MAG: excinuclease ATPase subunit [Gammaproteobacteria bacterium]